MLAAKNGKKDDTVEEKEETTEEKVEETTVEENLQKADEEIKKLKEDCSCGHGSDCNCGPECGCGCNSVEESVTEEVEAVTIQDAVNESQERLKYLIGR